MVTQEQSLSTGQASRILGISREHVLRLIQAGRLPATATPLGYLLPASAVEAERQRRIAKASA